MFTRIMVPLDGSERAESAVRLASELAAGPGAAIVLVHVHGPVMPGTGGVPDAGVRHLEGVRSRLDDLARELASATGAPVDVVLLEGSAGRELCRYAEEESVDLIVMSSHGRTGLARMWLGSVADHVTRRATVPVLVVRSDDADAAGAPVGTLVESAPGTRARPVTAGFRRILVGIDFTDSSLAAAKWAAAAFGPDAEIVLFHALDLPVPPGFLADRFAPAGELLETARRGALARLREAGDALGAKRMHIETAAGSPAVSLAAAVPALGCDVIVVGPHAERSGVWQMMSSTAERLLQISPVPVVLTTEAAPAPPSRFLVPIDDSPAAMEAVSVAAALRERRNAAMTVLHALEPGLKGRIGIVSSSGAAAKLEREMETDAERWTRECVGRYVGADIDFDVRIVWDRPAPAILSTARETGADLIVMGSRGAGSAGRRIVGSVARSVLGGSPCPVMVVTDSRD